MLTLIVLAMLALVCCCILLPLALWIFQLVCEVAPLVLCVLACLWLARHLF